MLSETSRAAHIRVGGGVERARYDRVAISLHWATVILVLVQFGTSQLWGFAARPTRHVMIVSHMSFGILLGVIVIARLIWRFVPGHQVRPTDRGLTEALAQSVHFLLYALLVAQTALGVYLRWAGGEAMSFFGFALPSPFTAISKEAQKFIGELHYWVGWAIIVIAFGHALAALYHHFVLRDGVLKRMLPAA